MSAAAPEAPAGVRVLFWSLVFGPDTVSTANLMTELAAGLQQKGHEVSVITSIPHYNPSPEVRANPVYHPRFPRLFTDSSEGGVRVLRLMMPLKGRRVWRRALDYLWFHVLTLLIVLWRVPKQDVILVISPPVTLGLLGRMAAAWFDAALVYDVRELWPDVPIRMGLIRNRLAVRAIHAAESAVYRRSALITCIAKSFERALAARGVPLEKLRYAPNFVDVDWLKPAPKDNAFSREHGVRDRFVALYAGNIGLTQGLEILVDVAREMIDCSDVLFLVIGDGAGRDRLERAIRDSGLSTIRLLPFQRYSDVPLTYASADICLSPMLRGFSYDTVPSKICTALAAGRPVVAAAEPDTETAELLEQSRSGLVVSPESPGEMARAVRQLRDDPRLRLEMGQRGRDWIVRWYSRDAVVEVYNRVVREAVRKPA